MAKGVQSFLKDQGWEVYIDWQDAAMPPKPSRVTAENIQLRIQQLDWFFYLATRNSAASRWCPWEIGYADGVKKYDSIIIIPTIDSVGHTFGSEYLQLYRHIDNAEGGGFGAFATSGQGIRLAGMRRS